ncbi:hypothetical protein BSKO_06356 [Bryopsis sp. KO-2023]|nr:hypothetical protein BSKO_06356 [Bryopsis sp. KO-2023]
MSDLGRKTSPSTPVPQCGVGSRFRFFFQGKLLPSKVWNRNDCAASRASRARKLRYDRGADYFVTTASRAMEWDGLEDQLGEAEWGNARLQLALRDPGYLLDQAKNEQAIREGVSTRVLASIQEAEAMLLRRLGVNGDGADPADSDSAKTKVEELLSFCREKAHLLHIESIQQDLVARLAVSLADEGGAAASDLYRGRAGYEKCRRYQEDARLELQDLDDRISALSEDLQGGTSEPVSNLINTLVHSYLAELVEMHESTFHAKPNSTTQIVTPDASLPQRLSPHVDREHELLMRISKLEDELQASRAQLKLGDAERAIQIGLGGMVVAHSLATHFDHQRQMAVRPVLQDWSNRNLGNPSSARGLGNSGPFQKPPVCPSGSEPRTPVNGEKTGPHDSFSFSPTAGTEERGRPWEDLEEMNDPEFAKAFKACLGYLDEASSDGDGEEEEDVISDSEYDEDEENDEIVAKQVKLMQDLGKNMEIVADKLEARRPPVPYHAEPNAALKWNAEKLEERALMWKKEEEKHREEYDKCDELLVIARFDLKDAQNELKVVKQKREEENERFHREMAAAQKEWNEIQGNLTEVRSVLESEKQKASSFEHMSKEVVALSKQIDEKQSLLADLEESRQSMIKALDQFSWENPEVKCCGLNKESSTQEVTTDSVSIHCSDDEQSTSRQNDAKKDKISKEEFLDKLWEKESEIVKLRMEVRMLTAATRNGGSQEMTAEQKTDLTGEASIELHELHVQSQQVIAKVADHQKQLISMEKQKNAIVRFIEDADEKRNDAEEKMETAKADLKATLEESDSAQSSVRKAREDLQAIEEKLNGATEEIEIKESELEKVQASLDATQTQYAEMEKKTLSYQHDMESALYESRKVEHDLQISRSELASIGKQLEERESRLKTANEDLGISESKHSALQSEVSKLAEEKDSLEHRIKKQEAAMSAVVEEFNLINKQRTSAEKNIKIQEANIDALAEELEKKQQELEAKMEELGTTTQKKESMVQEVKAVKEDLEEAEKLLEKVNESRNRSHSETLQLECQINVQKEELKNLTDAKTSALRCGGIGTVSKHLTLGSSSPLSLDFGDISQQVAFAQQQALHQQQVNQQLREEQGYLLQTKNQAERQVESARMDLKSLKEQMDSVTAQLDRVKRDRDRMDRSLEESKEEVEHKERELKRLKEKLSDIKAQINSAREEKEKVLECIESLRDRSTDFNSQLPPSVNRSPSVRHAEERADIFEMENRIEEAERQTIRLKAKLEKAQQHIVHLEDALEKKRQPGTNYMNREDSAEKIQMSIRKAETQLRTIQEEKCLAEEERDAAQSELHEISRKLSTLQNAALESDGERTMVESVRRELKSVKSQLLAAERERACAQQEAAQLKNQLQKAKEEASCRVQEADDTKDSAVEELRVIDEKFSKANERIRQLEDDIDALRWKNNRLEKANAEYVDQIRRGRADLNDKAQVIKFLEADKKSHLEELKTAKEENRKWERMVKSGSDHMKLNAENDIHVNLELLQELERTTKACKEWKGKDKEKQRALQQFKVEYGKFADAIEESNTLREEINSQKIKLEKKCGDLEKTIQGQKTKIVFLRNEKSALEEIVAAQNLMNSNTMRNSIDVLGSGRSSHQMHPKEAAILFQEIRLLSKLLDIPEDTATPDPKLKYGRVADCGKSTMRSSPLKKKATVAEMLLLIRKIGEAIRSCREPKAGMMQEQNQESLPSELLDCDHCAMVRSASELAKELGGGAQSVIAIVQAARKATKTGRLDISSVWGKILREARHMHTVCEASVRETEEEKMKVCATLKALESTTMTVRGLEERINRLGAEGNETSKAHKRRLERVMLLNRVKDAQIRRCENSDNNSATEESSKNWSF